MNPKIEIFKIGHPYTTRGKSLAGEIALPEGKIVRVLSGGTDSLKQILLDLKKYSFSGYVRTIFEKQGKVSIGHIIVKEGNPEISTHTFNGHLSHGRASLKRIWEDSYNVDCKIELHARVDVDALLDQYAAGVIDRAKKRARPAIPSPKKLEIFEGKLEEWRKEGYDVSPLEKILKEEPSKAKDAFFQFQENVKKAKVLKEILDSLDSRGFESQVESIRSKLKNASLSLALEAEIQALTEKIEMARWEEGLKKEEILREKETQEKAREIFEMVIKHRIPESKITKVAPSPPIEEKPVLRDERTNLIRQYTFEGFVVGPCNRFAHAASLAVAKSPHSAYNPLFITSGPGLGKTHLLNAIGNYIVEHNGNAKVIYLSAERFANELKEAIESDKLTSFRDKYRNVDILLLDDTHFLSRREEAQEELFHTFNALHMANKQIALTSDRPPKEIPALEDRLVSRFESGLIADIQPPEYETRMAILRRRAREAGADADEDVLSFIANVVQDNIRELGGALNRVLAFSSLMGQEVSLGLAKEVLKDLALEEKEKKGEAKLEQLEKELRIGRSYLVEEERPSICFRLFSRSMQEGGAGILITRANPKRVREKYDILGQRILWLTDRESTTEETLPPSLERIIHTIEEFMRKRGKGAILIDGVEYLVSNNNFDAVLRFLRRLIDHVSESQFLFLLSLSPGTLKERESKILEKEMEVLDFR